MTDDVPHFRRRRWLGWTIAGVVALVLLCVGWVVVRGVGASAALSSVVRTADQAEDIVNAGSSEGLSAAAKRIAADAANARVLTTDPLWRAMEAVPGLGGNLAALRQVSEAADDIARDAIPALVAVAQSADLATLGMSRNRIDITPLAAVGPRLDEAALALARAERAVRDVGSEGLLPPFGAAVHDTLGQIRSVSHATAQLAGAAGVLPSLLGGQGPRTVLVILQDNARLRSSGGAPAAFALLRLQNGAVTLSQVVGAGALRSFAAPVVAPSAATEALFGATPGMRWDDALSAPGFPEGAAATATMWAKAVGGRVDAVVAIDAVALGELLEATGPLTVGGVEVTGDGVATIVTGGGPEHAPPASAAFVGALVSGVFAATVDGTVDPRRTLSALVRAGDDHRLRVWLADPAAQERLADTTLAGSIPPDGGGLRHVAVLANDTTGGAMDAYADASVTARVGACGEGGRTVLRVSVEWRSTAPDDAATALPAAVAGPGSVPRGTTGTKVAVVGPQGWTMTAASATGEALDERDAELDGRAVRQYELRTPPGGSQKLTVEYTAPDGERPRLEVRVTPMIGATPVTTAELACG